jgi:hypothetical protein
LIPESRVRNGEGPWRDDKSGTIPPVPFDYGGRIPPLPRALTPGVDDSGDPDKKHCQVGERMPNRRLILDVGHATLFVSEFFKLSTTSGHSDLSHVLETVGG